MVNENRGVPAVKQLNLDVRGGEIVGIAGIDGNGQSELVQAITGLRKVKSGSITIQGQDVTHITTRKITELSVGHVPEDRHRDGLVLEMTLAENMALQTYYKEPMSKNGILNFNNINEHARKLMKEFDVRGANELVPAKGFSGGNQQKAIVAREIDKNPELLVAVQPTRGLDVGAIEYIHEKIVEQRDAGKAVLLISLELDEVMNLSDRILVMYEGEIVGELNPKETTLNELGLYMAGANKNKKGENKNEK